MSSNYAHIAKAYMKYNNFKEGETLIVDGVTYRSDKLTNRELRRRSEQVNRMISMRICGVLLILIIILGWVIL